MYSPIGARQKALLPVAAICCLALVLFLIVITIILALIPIYIPQKDVTALQTPDDNNTLFVQYSADATEKTSVSGPMENTDAIATALGVRNNAIVGEAYAKATFIRQRRSIGSSREKRTLKIFFLVVIKFVASSRCNNGPCLVALRTKVKSEIQKTGNIASFPCQVRSPDANNATNLTSFNVAATYLGFVDASTARLGFRSVQTLIFVAAQNGNFTDPATWVGGVIPFGSCTVIIPAGITVTLTLLALEIPMQVMHVYGTFAAGSGSSPFTFNYATNIIAHPGAVIQLLSTVKTLVVPKSSVVTLYPSASFSSSGVVVQISNSSDPNSNITITSASGPLTCGILPSGQILSFNAVTYIVAQNGSFTSGSTYLGGLAPSIGACSASYACDLYIAPNCTLTTSNLNGVLNMNIGTITVPTGAVLQLGTPGSPSGFKFMYPVLLQVYGKLAFVGTAGAGIYLPAGSYWNLYSGAVFTSEVVTFIQLFDPKTLKNIGTPLSLNISIGGPYYIVISSTGVSQSANPGGAGITTTSSGTGTTTTGTTSTDTANMNG